MLNYVLLQNLKRTVVHIRMLP